MNPNPIHEVHRRVGRNLLRYQEIELGLKFILPFMHPEGGKQGLESLKRFKTKEVDGKTLGLLIERFRESGKWSPQIIDDGLTRVNDSRNKLVHHFYELPGIDFLDPDSLEKAIAYLDEEFEAAEQWHRIVTAQSLALLLIRIDNSPDLTAKYAHSREKLLKRLETYKDIIQVDGI